MGQVKWSDEQIAATIAVCQRVGNFVPDGLRTAAAELGYAVPYRTVKDRSGGRLLPRRGPGAAIPADCGRSRRYGGKRAPRCAGGGGCLACWTIYNARDPGRQGNPRAVVDALPRAEREPPLLAALVSLTRRKVVTLLEACEALRAAPQDVREAIEWAQREGYHLQVEGDRVFSRLAIQAFEAATFGEPKPGRYRVAHLTDIHFGSRHCDVTALRSFLRYAESVGCVAGLCTGDVTDGHSPKLTFDQTAVGLDDQLDVALNAMRGSRLPWFAITGNHDGYHSSNTGIDTGRVMAERMQAAGIDWRHVGVCVGDVVLHGARFHLWHPHGGAGTRNAVRRVMNDRAEDMARNDNAPHALLLGHFHKHTSFTAYPERTFCASGGTFQRKGSEFANRIAREWDVGASIISFTVGDDGKPREFSAEFQEAA